MVQCYEKALYIAYFATICLLLGCANRSDAPFAAIPASTPENTLVSSPEHNAAENFSAETDDSTQFTYKEIPAGYTSEKQFADAVKDANEKDASSLFGQIEYYLGSKNLPESFELMGISALDDAYIDVHYRSTKSADITAMIKWQRTGSPELLEYDIKNGDLEKYNGINYKRIKDGFVDVIQAYYCIDDYYLFAKGPGQWTPEEFEAFCQVEKVFIK